MLIQSFKQITQISDNCEINSSNYIESLNYIDNLYSFLNHLKKISFVKEINFVPTFKGKNTCEKYNIDATEAETEMRVFVLESDAFLEDEKRAKIEDEFMDVCDSIEQNGKRIKFTLKAAE